MHILRYCCQERGCAQWPFNCLNTIKRCVRRQIKCWNAAARKPWYISPRSFPVAVSDPYATDAVGTCLREKRAEAADPGHGQGAGLRTGQLVPRYDIPAQYKTNEEIWSGKWLYEQRRILRGEDAHHSLTEQHREKILSQEGEKSRKLAQPKQEGA